MHNNMYFNTYETHHLYILIYTQLVYVHELQLLKILTYAHIASNLYIHAQ